MYQSLKITFTLEAVQNNNIVDLLEEVDHVRDSVTNGRTQNLFSKLLESLTKLLISFLLCFYKAKFCGCGNDLSSKILKALQNAVRICKNFQLSSRILPGVFKDLVGSHRRSSQRILV